MRDVRLWLLVAIGAGLVLAGGADLAGHLAAPPPSAPSTRLLIIDNSLSRPVYLPVRQWKQYTGDVPVDSVHMPTAESLPSLNGYTHMIISGSSASLVEPPEWADAEAELVRRAQAQGLAILGSCFGHQMLVYALSGPKHVQRADSPEVGWIPITMASEDPLFEGVPTPWHAFAWHYDHVVDPPPPWRVLASSPNCDVHVIRYGDAPIWGVQSHPETNPRTAKFTLLLQRLFRYDGAIEVCVALCQEPQDDGVIAALVRRFLATRPSGMQAIPALRGPRA